ncbi:MAG TPA: EAL domain-containing protein, partial [Candidatus Manganitrophaceae bacterium]|nr:EAL domain-containing protein [Candidatus Manganitrophaceae bacterium]
SRGLLDAMQEWVFRISGEGVFLDFKAPKEKTPLVLPSDLLGKKITDAIPKEEAQKAMRGIEEAIQTGATQTVELQIESNGKMRDYEVWFVAGGENEVIAVVRDITDRKAGASILEYHALYDSLTDLPNRALFHDRLQQAILTGQREGQSVSVLVLGLDRFKEINNTLGYQQGDILLKQIGPRLRKILRASNTVARFVGDEFAVILPNTPLKGGAVVAQKILEALGAPFTVEEMTLQVKASIGIALFPDHAADAESLTRMADVAMYMAKEAESGYAIYVSEQDHHSLGRLSLMSDLRRALDDDAQLFLLYQPKVNLQTNRVDGVEALIRWRHPSQGLISPDQFIPLAEQTGMIKPLTPWVLNAALRDRQAWRRAGLEIPVAVNISARNLHDPLFPEEVERLFSTSEASPEWLELEITESSIMSDPPRAMETLTRFSKMGIRISIDDFGVGYSSLGYLKRLPIDKIKIDKSFIIGYMTDSNDAVIVRSTIDLGHNLGLKVIAEGVENRQTLEKLISLGCDTAQGYYLSRPLPVDELARWLVESPYGLKAEENGGA